MNKIDWRRAINYFLLKDFIKGFKLGKNYDVSDLPSAIEARSAIYDKKDIELRKYLSHNDAI